MATPFTRTMRSLEGGHQGPWPRLVAALAILGFWGAWMTCARVTVYATSSSARLEVTGMAHHVAAHDTGRIVELQLGLGRPVAEGAVLLVLDSTVEQRKLDEALAHVEALAPRMESLRVQIEAEREAASWQWKVDGASLAKSQADALQAELTALRDGQLDSVSQRLHDENLASGIDTLNADSVAHQSRAKATGAKADVRRMAVTQRYDDKMSLVRVAELRQKVADLEGEAAAARAAIETARAELARRTVRAPATGTLGAVGTLQVGDVLKAGDAIATIVPGGEVRIVAEFQPADAVGRILPRQHAAARISGFPWTQFGVLEANVSEVAKEARDGTVRVELVIDAASSGTRIPLQHGLPGTVDVEVDRVSPWTLLLRSAGAALQSGTPPAAAPPAPTAPMASPPPVQ
jgi:multidrug resistance efflux pump